MFTTRVQHGDYEVTLGRSTRLSLLMYAYYKRIFTRLMPEAEQALSARNEAEFLETMAALDGATIVFVRSVQEFITIAAAVQGATGFAFRWPEPGELPGEDLVMKMFGHYLLDRDEPDGLWRKLGAARDALLTPLAPPEQQPPSVRGLLSDLEKTDPNSPAPVETGSNGSGKPSSDPLPVGGSLPGTVNG